jgi:hypothetical protein
MPIVAETTEAAVEDNLRSQRYTGINLSRIKHPYFKKINTRA